MPCLFNSFDPYFKQPFGAVRAGQSVHLSLCIPEELGYVDPHLVLQKEGRYDVPVHYRMKFDGQTPHQNHFSVDVTLNDVGLYFYYFDLYTDFRRIVRGPDNCGVVSWQEGESWQITVYESDFETPAPIKGKVFYQIFPDRFCEGVENKPMPFPDRLYQADKHAEPFWQPNEVGGHLNEDYFGGDLKGIQMKLPYLREMGVDYLYLNPIFEAHSNHRYNTADYLNVDPLLGTNEDFEALCAEARKYGIGIVLDGVFSHTGSDSRYFNREGRYGEGGAYRDPNSPYRSWYDFDSKYKGGYRSWWGFETLPEVNEETPSYVEFITGEGGVIDTWLRRGAAGFRLDVADELPDEFIEKVRTAVKRVGPDKFLLGEVWEDATTKFGFDKRRTYLLGKGLDSVMNYPFKNAVLGFVCGRDAGQTMTDILSICEHYPAPALHVLMNFMSTHDTVRAITAIAGESCEGRDRYWQSARRLTPEQYENGRRKYVSQKERQKNETGRKKIRRDAQGRVAALASFEGLPVGVFRGRRHLPFGRGPAHAVCGPGLHTYRRWHTDERHAHRPVGLYHSNGLVPEAGRQGRRRYTGTHHRLCQRGRRPRHRIPQRGACLRRGCKNVHHRRACHRLRHAGQRYVGRDLPFHPPADGRVTHA